MNMRVRPEPSRRVRLATGSPGRLLAAVAACLALTACQQPSPRPDTPPAVSAEASTRPAQQSAPTSHGPVYQATNKPCDLVDHRLLTQLFGPDINDVTPPQYTRNTIVTTMACHRSYSRHGAGTTVVPVRIQLADPAAIQVQYQGLRRLIEGRTTVTDVPGLGQSAYTYLDKSTGPQLALYDGNAYLTIGAVPISAPTPPATRTLPVLTQLAQIALARLKSGTKPDK